MRPIIWQSRAKTAELLIDLNEPHEAKEKNIQALKTIAEIENLFDDQELGTVFNRNAVQQLQEPT